MRGASYAKIVAETLAARYRNKCIKCGLILIVFGGFLFSLYKQGALTQRHTAISAHSQRSKPDIPIAALGQSKQDIATINTTLSPANKTPADRTPADKTPADRTLYPPIDLEKYVPPLEEIFDRTVIVTATSSNHVEELKAMVATVQMHLPDTKIIVYDLGLRKKERQTVLRMCNIMEVRYFDYVKYPRHVKDLLNYAWKPPIIKETLYEFGAIFWADTSIRFKQSIFPLYRHLESFHGYIPVVSNYATTDYKYSNYNKTHPDMFLYLGVDLHNTYKNDRGYTPAVQGGRLLFVNSSFINEKLLQPWVDCAMAELCIAPKGSQNPHLKRMRGYYVHRYDQSALGVLMYKNLRGLFRSGHDASEVSHSVSDVRNDNGPNFKNTRKLAYCD